MRNTVPLRPSDITPDMVIQDVASASRDLEQIFVVGFSKNKGESPVMWVSGGDLGRAALAALMLQDMARDFIEGSIAGFDGEPLPPHRPA